MAADDSRSAGRPPELLRRERSITRGVFLAHVDPDEGLGAVGYGERLTDLIERLGAESRADDAAFDAITELQLGALRPSPWEDEQYLPGHAQEQLTLLQTIRTRVWRRIERWHRTARSGRTVTERRAAAARLLSLGKMLAGDRRGRRRRTVSEPIRLRAAYEVNLFRLQEARRRLPTLPSRGVPRVERIRKVAAACGLPFDFLRDHLLTTLDDIKRLDTIKTAARELTAHEFRVTAHTVSNVLALGPKFPSPK